MTCIRCNHGTAKRFGTYGKAKPKVPLQCLPRTFSTHKRRLGRHYISTDQATQILELLMEGMSVRAILPHNGAAQIHNSLAVAHRWRADAAEYSMRGCEISSRDLSKPMNSGHSFTRKSGSLFRAIIQEWGDTYIWMAIDSETKLVLSYLTAKREAASAYTFISDLGKRVRGHFQITTDGFKAYIPAIEERFRRGR